MARTASDTATRSADSSCKVELTKTRNRWSGGRIGIAAAVKSRRLVHPPAGRNTCQFLDEKSARGAVRPSRVRSQANRGAGANVLGSETTVNAHDVYVPMLPGRGNVILVPLPSN